MRPLSFCIPLIAAAIARFSTASPVMTKQDFDVTALLTTIADISPVKVFLDDTCGELEAIDQTKATRLGIKTEANDTSCADVTLLFARGTCGAGNMGSTVGPALAQELRKALGSKTLAVQGINYPASIDGYLHDRPEGGDVMANLVKSTQSRCPNSKIVLSGHSQGGYAVHNAASALGVTGMSHVGAAVTFGDPKSGEPVVGLDSSKQKVYCHPGDDICMGGDLILPPHSTYEMDVDEASNFIVSALGLSKRQAY